MAEELFPVFDFPDIEDAEDEQEQELYKPSVYFDFEAGDFARDGANRLILADGRDAFIQWCIKAVQSEREELLAYGEDYGTEFEELSEISDRDQRENWIEETIADCLMENPACESVSDFEFRYEGDQFWVSFLVKGYDWNEEEIEVQIS